MKICIEMLTEEIPVKEHITVVNNIGKKITDDSVPEWAQIYTSIMRKENGEYTTTGEYPMVGRIYFEKGARFHTPSLSGIKVIPVARK